uniref:Uncharacterized protein n=1 Tax=Pipistrellus kuhlii TaxID=59472 RepID=A0A7J8B1I5_PIPKU|nr:hypothetical protein mPipKuh1_007857 [Pipistrellus kuhlii]
MWFLVQIKILVCIWNLKSVIRNETPLLKPPLVRRNLKVTGEGRAICSPKMRLLNALFKSYKRTCKLGVILAKLGDSYYFRKQKRKKKIFEICLYLLSMKKCVARSVETSPKVSLMWGKEREQGNPIRKTTLSVS